MAAYVQDVITWTTTAGDKTASITPAVGGLLVVFFGNSGTPTPGTISDDQGGTYTQIVSCTRAAGAHYGAIAIRDQLIASAVAHIVTLTQSGDTGGGLNVMEISGMTKAGASAARQSGSQSDQGAGATPAVFLGGVCLTENPTLGAVFNASNPATVTEPTSWTERRDVGYNNPNSGLETVTRDSGFTGDTITWGSTGGSAFGAVAVELDTSADVFVPRNPAINHQNPAFL